jgi:hypothetical protein
MATISASPRVQYYNQSGNFLIDSTFNLGSDNRVFIDGTSSPSPVSLKLFRSLYVFCRG